MMRRKQAHNIVQGNDFIEEPWRKQITLASHPLIEFHSRWTNNHVRGISGQLHSWSGLSNADDRYQRVKNRAMAMIPHLLNDYGMPKEEADWFRAQLMPVEMPNLLQRAYA